MARAKSSWGFDERGGSMRIAPASFATIIAEAFVVDNKGRYLRLERNVSSPGFASSIPATPVISTSGSPSSWQPRILAISSSFMKDSPLVIVSHDQCITRPKADDKG